jgi:hypothetical protein
MEDPASYPEYVLAIHSSKRLLVEQISPPAYVLADAIISLTLAKGQRHEVHGWSSKKLFSFLCVARRPNNAVALGSGVYSASNRNE